jgi:hypothetical protein
MPRGSPHQVGPELASKGPFIYDPAPHCRAYAPSAESCPSIARMSSTRANLICAAVGCAIALLESGCATPLSPPFAKHEAPKNSGTSSATLPLPVAPSALPIPESPQPDMTAVLDKLQQVRSIDPSAEQRLLDELRQVPASSWPLVAEQFRASLAYREQLAEKTRAGTKESQPVVDLRRAPLTSPFASSNAKEFVATNVSYEEKLATNNDRPSAPIGSLQDPHGANSDASPGLTRTKPYSMPSPLAETANAQADPKAPAQFSGDGPAYPIGDKSRAPMDKLNNAAAAEPRHVASQALAGVVRTPSAKQVTAEELGGRVNAVRLPDTRSASDPNWQQSTQKAIADLEHRVSSSPTTTAEVHQHVSLRMLRLLAGDTEKALEPIPHITPSEQDYWSRQLFALATYLDHHSQPDDKRRAAATVTHLEEAVSNLRELGSLSLRNLSFCKTVYGYGAIEPYEADTFSPGQHVSIYVEVENYHSTSSEKGFNTSLGTTYEVLDDRGKRVASGDFPDVNDCCRSRRRDFHLQLGLKLPETIAAGRYQVQLLVKDRQSDKIGNSKASFEIRGGKK